MSVLTVTPQATEQLLQRIRARQGGFVRVMAAPACGCGRIGYSMRIESEPSDDDQVLEVAGVRFLVDGESYPYIEGGTIDYRDEMVGGGFTIDSPNAQGGCGCGGH